MSDENKYTNLSRLSDIYQFFALIFIAITIIYFVSPIFNPLNLEVSIKEDFLTYVFTNLGLIIAIISIFALSEGIKLFIDIEKNTRK